MRRESEGGILASDEDGTHNESNGYSSATNSWASPDVEQPFDRGLQV